MYVAERGTDGEGPTRGERSWADAPGISSVTATEFCSPLLPRPPANPGRNSGGQGPFGSATPGSSLWGPELLLTAHSSAAAPSGGQTPAPSPHIPILLYLGFHGRALFSPGTRSTSWRFSGPHTCAKRDGTGPQEPVPSFQTKDPMLRTGLGLRMRSWAWEWAAFKVRRLLSVSRTRV